MTKEKLKEEWDRLCLLDIEQGGWNVPYEGIIEDKAFDWFYSKLQEIRSEDMRGLSNKFEGLGYMTLTLGEVLTIIKQDTPHEHVSDGLSYTSNPPKSRCIECGNFYK